MNKWPKITIVTPSFNSAVYLEDTIKSILNQQYPNLEYIIIDGGSTDGSVDIIQKYESQLAYWVSEKDDGLYPGLNKGFALLKGEIMGWLNADDILHPGALRVITGIFEQFPEVEWLQGYPTVIDGHGSIVYHRNPVKFADFFYNGGFENGCFVQQESTFWRRSLWDKAGAYLDKEYHLAGDFELWMRFFRHAKMYTTDAILGAFRVHATHQMSRANRDEYMQQCREIIAREKGLGFGASAINKKRRLFARRPRFPAEPAKHSDDAHVRFDFLTGKYAMPGNH